MRRTSSCALPLLNCPSVVQVDGRLCTRDEADILVRAATLYADLGAADFGSLASILRFLLAKGSPETKVRAVEKLVREMERTAGGPRQVYDPRNAASSVIAHHLRARLERDGEQMSASRRHLAGLLLTPPP